MTRDSKRARAVRIAYEKGYRVINGQVLSPKGKIRKCHLHPPVCKPNYYSFNVHAGESGPYPVHVHHLLALQKFGEALFAEGVHVRHLDGNSTNNLDENIVLGSQSDNMLDCPVQSRREHAAKCNQQYSAESIAEWRREHTKGKGYKKLNKQYGVPISTLRYYLSTTAKCRSFSFPI